MAKFETVPIGELEHRRRFDGIDKRLDVIDDKLEPARFSATQRRNVP